MEKLEITKTDLPELKAVRITLVGGVDVFSYKDLKQAFDQLGGEDKPALLLDMSGVTYVGSSGWSVIFLQSSIQEKESAALLLFGMNERVERSLNIIMPRKRHVNVAPDFESAKTLLETLRNSVKTPQN